MFYSLSLGRFYGIDSLIEILIIAVSIIICYYSQRIYKIVRDKNYQFFSFAFLFIAISFVFKISSNFTILHRVQVHGINFVYTVFTSSQLFEKINFFSFGLYKVFYLLAFLILFLILTKNDGEFNGSSIIKSKSEVFMFVYLSLIAVLFSIYFNFIFDITLSIILFFLAIHFSDNYRNKKSANTLIVFAAFIIILTSHFFFIFSDVNSLCYMLGEGLLLLAFLCLLINQIKVIGKGKKLKASKQKRVSVF